MSAALDYLAQKVATYQVKYDNFKFVNKIVAEAKDASQREAGLCLNINVRGHHLQITGEEALAIIGLIHEQNIEAGVELAKLNSTLKHVNRVLNSAEEHIEGEQHEEE